MSAFNGDSLDQYGGALFEDTPPIDSDTDRPAAGANRAYTATAAMTHTALRIWAQITPAGTGTPVLTAHDAMWGKAALVAPVPTRTGVGTYRLTYAATQQDEITDPAAPGYTGPQSINLRGGDANSQGGATYYDAKVTVVAPNILEIRIWSGASPPALVDPTGVTFDVFAL